MPLYILDASALIALEDTCIDAGHQIEDILDSLTELAIQGSLVCPPLVIKECRRLGDGESTVRWLRASSGHFSRLDDPWDYMETVLSSCPELIDPDDMNENPQVAVLALALFSQTTSNEEVIVVTDQWVDSPMRQSLGTAAAVIDVMALPVKDFVLTVAA
ncbi:hypothetical protein GTU71_12975 [Rathayibacter sp. VKM Ac-2762]|uniref:hypothetical protein n=1 Tax=Rathayibacter sp. VKM Ac-2762 TaxID=2609254 RepID=UPI00132F21A5|nr:hypothetical protein [Rathayibacter sp. VKM Ac-2762]QHF21654.1 hypothetical protein GTU71_12975 [Rathayibacter sp. VKM Ac-2762]